MAVHKLLKVTDPHAPTLRARLVQEWSNRGEPGPGGPVIVRDEQGPSGPVRYFVIWDQWASIPQQERSEIIMEAYEQANASSAGELPNEFFRITIAMGLTPEEAKRMGIAYH